MAAARNSRRGSRRTIQIIAENNFCFRHRLNLEQALAQLGRPWETLRIPAQMLAELEGSLARVALQPQRQARVLQRGCKTLFGRWIGTLRAALQEVARLREQPGIPE